MSRIEGCGLALVGVAIAVASVYGGVMGSFVAMQEVHPAQAWAFIGLAFVGSTIGLTFFVGGIVKAISGGEGQNSSPESLEKRLPEEEYCQNFGSQLVGDTKTCKWCGADLK